MTTRNAHKVIYFANYIGTNIEEEARAEALVKMAPGGDEPSQDVRRKHDEAVAELQTEFDEASKEAASGVEAEVAKLEEQMTTTVNKVMTEVQELQERIKTTEGKKATRDFALGAKTEFETVVVKKSEAFTPEIAAGLGKIAEEAISKVETGFKATQDEAKAPDPPAD